MDKKDIQFPTDFTFGVGTSCYQVEGAVAEDGRTPSIWDTFSHTSGRVFSDHTGDIACDHYHRYLQDVDLIAKLGVSSYRFSIAWPRIFPAQRQRNERGLDFYKRLLEALHQRNIQPAVTLYHWDLPQWLDDLGGWVNRDVTEHYLEYATTVFRELDGYVSRWTTHNEPWCTSFLGYGYGQHAPGHRDLREAFIAAHHVLLSHGQAVAAFRSGGWQGEIGITLNLGVTDAASDLETDTQAARLSDGFGNRWFLDPLLRGEYPADAMEKATEVVGPLTFVRPEDLPVIHQPLDFLGVNYYMRHVVRADANAPLTGARELPPAVNRSTDMGWEMHPESLYRLLCRLRDEYTSMPLYVTENGAAFHDVVVDGEVHDVQRIEYLADHLHAASLFTREGGNLKGYYLWSLLDNFEWAYGYDKRFGITYVDFATQERILKDSGRWYMDLVRRHRNSPLPVG